MERLLLLAFCLVLSLSALAGGSAWPVTVIEVERPANAQAVLKLKNDKGDRGDHPQACEILIVRAVYLPEWERRDTWSDFVKEDDHIAALDLLESHKESGTPIDFGFIGYGLIPLDKDKPCDVAARALWIYDGAVLAFNNPI